MSVEVNPLCFVSFIKLLNELVMFYFFMDFLHDSKSKDIRFFSISHLSFSDFADVYTVFQMGATLRYTDKNSLWLKNTKGVESKLP